MVNTREEHELTAADEAMMEHAIRMAGQAAQLGEVPVGAVVYRDGNILAVGYNLRESTADPTAHAEIIAMRQAAQQLGTWRLDDCSLAVTLEPCPMCAGAMVNARLGRLIYGATDPKMGCVDTLYQLCEEPRFNHRVKVIAGVKAEKCGKVLTEFFQSRRGSAKPPKPRPPVV